ncbi:hypothetical protein HDA40_002129 [Hamadaea flava]|uniref:DUF4262 domain-containing protein n=1 Tax=Hamadaea flava TaxID=1742688 RepID=A0ABV8LJM3_9ACTN|nr:DUF4262 domain-containing protein [Hamadaea flava]MCP2323622.1 hypothetical protein [Hamadaea flava]
MNHHRPAPGPLTPEQQQWLQHTIETVGWAVITTALQAVSVDVPFAYTVGLTERDLPELLIVGVRHDTAISLLNDLARRANSSGPLLHGQRLDDLITGLDVLILEGPADGLLRPSAALYLYGPGAVRLQQCVWPDPDGRFPWEPGYTMHPAAQPTISQPEPS